MKKFLALLGILCCLCCGSAAGAAFRADTDENFDEKTAYVVQGTDQNTGEPIVAGTNVKDYGAVGDGVADDTGAIRRAIAGLLRNSGGGTLYFPAGTYRVTEPDIEIPQGVMFRGHWNDPSLGTKGEQTVILADFDADSSDKPLFRLSAESVLSDFCFYYPRQDIDNVQAYPFTIDTSELQLATIRHITLYNSYRGIDTTSSGQFVSDIYGTVLCEGLRIDHNAEVTDALKIRFDASFWNEYDGTPVDQIRAYTKAHATAVRIGYADDMLLYDLNAPDDQFALGVELFFSERSFGLGASGVAYGFLFQTNGATTEYTGDYRYPSETWPKMNFTDEISHVTAYEHEFAAPRFPEKTGIFNVRYYGAKGNGRADDTQAFEWALEDAGLYGGIVFVPAGDYVLTRPLAVPSGVELLGDWQGYRSGSPCRIYARYEGGEDEALIRLSENSGVQGLNFYLPDNQPESYATPVGRQYGYANGETYDYAVDSFPESEVTPKAFPWMIRAEGRGCWVENVSFTNAWNGIDFASFDCSDFVLRGIWGTCMNHGIDVGGGSSLGWVECCFFTFSTWWESIGRSVKLDDYTYAHTTGLTFGSCSDLQIFSACTFGIQRGVCFEEEDGGWPYNVRLIRMVADLPYGTVGLDLQAGDQISVIGISTGVLPGNASSGRNSAAIQVGENFEGKARLFAQNTWSGAPNLIRGDVQLYDASSPDPEILEHRFEGESGGCGGSLTAGNFLLGGILLAGGMTGIMFFRRKRHEDEK